MIGLHTSEAKVFKKLSYNSESVATLARKTKMPRMTVYTTLLRLKKKKLAIEVKSKTGKRILWSRNKDSAIQSELVLTQHMLTGSFLETGFTNLFVGKTAIQEELMRLTIRKFGAYMYSIQNSKNWVRWIEIMGKKWVNDHNKAVVDQGLVCFTIHSKEAPEKIKSDKEVISAYKGRLGGSHAIAESFLKKDISFYIFDETIFLVNLETVEAVEVTNKDLSEFLIKLFMFMFEKTDTEEFFRVYGR